MKLRRVIIRCVCLGTLAVAVIIGCADCLPIRGAREDSQALWMAALKGFEGPVYYVGSEGDFSYFRAGDIIFTRYKAQTKKIRLPNTFPLGKGKPYLVKEYMVPEY